MGSVHQDMFMPVPFQSITYAEFADSMRLVVRECTYIDSMRLVVRECKYIDSMRLVVRE